MNHRDNGIMLGEIAIILAAIVIVVGIITCICIPLLTQDTVTLTVKKTDTYTTTSCSSDSNGGSSCTTDIHNLLYTDGEILQFNDNLILWVWGSQTAFSHIESGKTYKFKVYGFNIAWLNWYRSVISYELID
jgi:hypothetical protein